MSKPIAITQRQITAICKGAKAAGCIAEVVIGSVTVRLLPDSAVTAIKAKTPEEFETLPEYLAWRDAQQEVEEEDIRF